LGSSKSFKVIDVNKSKKPVTSACYDKQHVCTYLQLGKITFLGGYPSLTPSFEGKPRT